MKQLLVIGTAITIVMTLQQQGLAADYVQFNRDVRHILAEHCWQCHGPEARARQAGLRLDVRENAIQPVGSGSVAIVPRAPRRSELLRRVKADDLGERMPPADSHPPLSATQIAILGKWIEQGAEYQ